MPRIDPLKLLVCLSVLLAPNGGIRSANEVKRLANLMAKFSKKLVSKCIYIQILKCTETELLSQFMAAGGWSLVHMWLADGITTKNWPLIQELLELLLCCPVDVERLKSNTAPKLVKSLSKDSSHEGVRLLATKLVEQWLKIARNDIRTGQQPASVTSVSDGKPNIESASQESLKTSSQETISTASYGEESVVEEEIIPDTVPIEAKEKVKDEVEQDGMVHEEEENIEETKKAFKNAVAESNEKKAPLLFKITMKNGKQVLAKVESPIKKSSSVDDLVETKSETVSDAKEDTKESVSEDLDTDSSVTSAKEVVSKENLATTNDTIDNKKDDSDSDKSTEKEKKNEEKERSKEKDKSSSKDKERHKDKDIKSSSSSHKSSSKSSSSSKHHHSSSSSSSSSSSKKQSSSSSSSSSKNTSTGSSSRDKDKDRSHSSKSSSHHKSSSSSSSGSKSSSSSKSNSHDKHRDYKDKDKHKSGHSIKDKDNHSKSLSPSGNKLNKNKDSKDSDNDKSDTIANKMSPISSKKASISIEVRSSENRPKTVKTYNSQFRSHGLIEEAPPPPSRKGLKKPSSAPTTPTIIGSTATGTILSKRSSPPPVSKEGPPEKKSREDPAERPGSIKLIPPKRQHSLVESDMFMDALSATLRRDVKKRKRRTSGSEGSTKAANDKSAPATPTTPSLPPVPETSPVEEKNLPTPPASPTADKPEPAATITSPVAAKLPGSSSPPNKVIAAPMSFYRDTLADSDEVSEEKKTEESKDEALDTSDQAVSEVTEEIKTEEVIPACPVEPDDDEDEIIKKPKRLKSELIEDDEADDKNLIDAVGDDVARKIAQSEQSQIAVPDAVEKRTPGPGCGPDGPPGVLVIHRRKGPKKTLKWKAPEDLEEIRYFELDVTERCNVTKTFTDLKHMERVDERKNYLLGRKLQSDDVMMEQTNWVPLVLIDNVPPHPEGVNSQEKRIQRERERNVLQALYFNRHMIPDSPAEPDVEVYSISEPAHIPLDDVTGNPDSVNDFTNMPWPEPKSTPPHESAGFNSPFFPGNGNDFASFGASSNWDMQGAGHMSSMFPTGRMTPGMQHIGGGGSPLGGQPSVHNMHGRGGHGGSPGVGSNGHGVHGAPGMMRHMNMPSHIAPNMPPNMPPHPNMFPNSFVRPPPMQHMNDRDDDNFRNGPPPGWFGGNNGNRGGPPQHQGNFGNRGGFGPRGGGGWNNNRDQERGPRGGNYRPPWLQNNRGRGGRKW